MTIQQSNYIKVVAILTMLIDHVGAILLPDMVVFRIIGRIAFPLFAYQLCIGYEHTKNLKRYISKMLLFGITIQFFFSLAAYLFKIDFDINKLNIFFVLALGLIAVYCFDKKKYFYLLFVFVVPFIYKLDYGLYGIVLILELYLLKKSSFNIAISMFTVNLIYCCLVQSGNYLQMFSLLSILFIAKPISLKLHIPCCIFYFFYPLHLIALYIISVVINNV